MKAAGFGMVPKDFEPSVRLRYKEDYMEEILVVQGLKKTFRISAKQQKLEKTREKIRTAVKDLSFSACRGY